jgi:hypothetical protein
MCSLSALGTPSSAEAVTVGEKLLGKSIVRVREAGLWVRCERKARCTRSFRPEVSTIRRR